MLSPAELAAPAFVAAALATATPRRSRSAAGSVAAGPRHRVGGEVLAVIADSRRSGIDAVLPTADGDIVLGTTLIGSSGNTARTSGMVGAFSRVFDRRGLDGRDRPVRVDRAEHGLLLPGRPGLAEFAVPGADRVDLDRDSDPTGLSTAFRFGAVIIQLFGLALLPGITAVIVDAPISARLAAITGGVRGKP